jgi:hypothetical protein
MVEADFPCPSRRRLVVALMAVRRASRRRFRLPDDRQGQYRPEQGKRRCTQERQL